MKKEKFLIKSKLRFIALLCLLTAITFNSVSAQEKDNFVPSLKFGGSVRLRQEVKNKFNFNDSYQDYFLTQVRFNLRWEPVNWVSFFIEGQDARVLGEDINTAPSINQDARPNIFHDNFDLHQGFADIKVNSTKAPLKIRIGRQKFNLGAMRLVASLEWVNTARVWDGVKVSYGNPNNRIVEVFGSRVVPVTPNSFNDYMKTKNRYFNSSFWGAYYTDKKLIPNVQVEAYWLYRNESSSEDNTHTLGGRIALKKGKLDFNSELAGQLGKFSGLDHTAYMFHIESGYSLDFLKKSRIAFTYNYGSGDDDPNDDKHKTFDNLYPLNHAYYGYMDLFSLQNVHNTEVTFSTSPVEKLNLRISWHNFWLANSQFDNWYNAGLGTVRKATGNDISSHVGNEIDVTVKYPLHVLNKKVVIVGGYSMFFSGEYAEQTGAINDPNFFFAMAKVVF